MPRPLLLGLLFLACSAAKFVPVADAGSTKPKASEVYKKQARVIELMGKDYPDVEVSVVWRPCGEKNAYYYPSLDAIVLCTELEDEPGTAVLFAAHEMGHAITEQLIDMTDEGAADELAALAMLKHGYVNELLEGAMYFKKKKYQGHYPGDDHPSAGYRAWFFACMAASNDLVPGECVDLAYTTSIRWYQRLERYRKG